MRAMFYAAWVFNQPLNDWQVDNVTDMFDMFYAAEAFNQNLGWCVDSGVDVTTMFDGTQCGPTCGVTFDCPGPP